MRGPALAVAVLAVLSAPPAAAHPHVFIDATIEVLFDPEGRAEALRIGWAYDELFSLTWLAENGIDPELDGRLTAEEEARLQGFDMDWDPSFAGDTFASLGERPLALSRPEAPQAWLDGARLVSTHLRRFEAPVALGAAELVVRVYDPSFYTAYTIAAQPVLSGREDCTVAVFEPDRAAADARLAAAIEELAGGEGVEGEFPAIGDAYAEEARVACAGR
jgi:polyphosphate kinase